MPVKTRRLEFRVAREYASENQGTASIYTDMGSKGMRGQGMQRRERISDSGVYGILTRAVFPDRDGAKKGLIEGSSGIVAER